MADTTTNPSKSSTAPQPGDFLQALNNITLTNTSFTTQPHIPSLYTVNESRIQSVLNEENTDTSSTVKVPVDIRGSTSMYLPRRNFTSPSAADAILSSLQDFQAGLNLILSRVGLKQLVEFYTRFRQERSSGDNKKNDDEVFVKRFLPKRNMVLYRREAVNETLVTLSKLKEVLHKAFLDSLKTFSVASQVVSAHCLGRINLSIRLIHLLKKCYESSRASYKGKRGIDRTQKGGMTADTLKRLITPTITTAGSELAAISAESLTAVLNERLVRNMQKELSQVETEPCVGCNKCPSPVFTTALDQSSRTVEGLDEARTQLSEEPIVRIFQNGLGELNTFTTEEVSQIQGKKRKGQSSSSSEPPRRWYKVDLSQMLVNNFIDVMLGGLAYIFNDEDPVINIDASIESKINGDRTGFDFALESLGAFNILFRCSDRHNHPVPVLAVYKAKKIASSRPRVFEITTLYDKDPIVSSLISGKGGLVGTETTDDTEVKVMAYVPMYTMPTDDPKVLDVVNSISFNWFRRLLISAETARTKCSIRDGIIGALLAKMSDDKGGVAIEIQDQGDTSKGGSAAIKSNLADLNKQGQRLARLLNQSLNAYNYNEHHLSIDDLRHDQRAERYLQIMGGEVMRCGGQNALGGRGGLLSYLPYQLSDKRVQAGGFVDLMSHVREEDLRHIPGPVRRLFRFDLLIDMATKLPRLTQMRKNRNNRLINYITNVQELIRNLSLETIVTQDISKTRKRLVAPFLNPQLHGSLSSQCYYNQHPAANIDPYMASNVYEYTTDPTSANYVNVPLSRDALKLSSIAEAQCPSVRIPTLVISQMVAHKLYLKSASGTSVNKLAQSILSKLIHDHMPVDLAVAVLRYLWLNSIFFTLVGPVMGRAIIHQYNPNSTLADDILEDYQYTINRPKYLGFHQDNIKSLLDQPSAAAQQNAIIKQSNLKNVLERILSVILHYMGSSSSSSSSSGKVETLAPDSIQINPLEGEDNVKLYIKFLKSVLRILATTLSKYSNVRESIRTAINEFLASKLDNINNKKSLQEVGRRPLVGKISLINKTTNEEEEVDIQIEGYPDLTVGEILEPFNYNNFNEREVRANLQLIVRIESNTAKAGKKTVKQAIRLYKDVVSIIMNRILQNYKPSTSLNQLITYSKALYTSTVLEISRAQKAFVPLHPSMMMMNNTFVPTERLFQRISSSYIDDTIQRLETHFQDIGSLGYTLYCNDKPTRLLNKESSSASAAASTGDHFVAANSIFSNKSLFNFNKLVKVDGLTNEQRVMVSCLLSNTDPSLSLDEKQNLDLVGSLGFYRVPREVINEDQFRNHLIAKPENVSKIVTNNIHFFTSTINSKERQIRLAYNSILSSGITATSTSGTKEDRERYRSTYLNLLNSGTSTATTSFTNTLLDTNDTSGYTLNILSSPNYRKVSLPDYRANVYFSSYDDKDIESDLLGGSLSMGKRYHDNLVKATQTLYDMCVLVRLLRTEQAAVNARTLLYQIMTDSPVYQHIDKIGNVRALMAKLATTNQYRRFIAILERHNNRNHTATEINFLDDRLSNANLRLMEEEDEEHYYYDDDDYGTKKRPANVGNTYATLTTTATTTSGDPNEPFPKSRVDDALDKMAETINRYVSEESGTVSFVNLTRANNIYRRFGHIVSSKKEDALTSFLSLVGETLVNTNEYDTRQSIDNACRIQLLKNMARTEQPHSIKGALVRSILALTGSFEHSQEMIDSIYTELTSNDLELFLGNSFLESGRFFSFFLRAFLFRKLDPNISVDQIQGTTRALLIRVLAICEIMKRAFTQSYNMEKRGLYRKLTSIISRTTALVSDIYYRTDNHILSDARLLGLTSLRPNKRQTSSLKEVLLGPTEVSDRYSLNYIDKAMGRSYYNDDYCIYHEPEEENFFKTILPNYDQGPSSHPPIYGSTSYVECMEVEDDDEEEEEEEEYYDDDNMSDDAEEDYDFNHYHYYSDSSSYASSSSDDDDDDDVGSKKMSVYGYDFFKNDFRDGGDDDEYYSGDERYEKIRFRKRILEIMKEYNLKGPLDDTAVESILDEFRKMYGSIPYLSNSSRPDELKTVKDIINDFVFADSRSRKRIRRDPKNNINPDSNALVMAVDALVKDRNANIRKRLFETTAENLKTIKNNMNMLRNFIFSENSIGLITKGLNTIETETFSRALFDDIQKAYRDMNVMASDNSSMVLGDLQGVTMAGSTMPIVPTISRGTHIDVFNWFSGYTTKGAMWLDKLRDMSRSFLKDSVDDRSYLDTLTLCGLFMGRHYSPLTYHNIQSILKGYRSLKKDGEYLQVMVEGDDVSKRFPKVRNTFIGDAINERMQYVDNLLGLSEPSVFLSMTPQHLAAQLTKSSTSMSTRDIQDQLHRGHLMVRELNSRQSSQNQNETVMECLHRLRDLLPSSRFSLHDFSGSARTDPYHLNRFTGTINLDMAHRAEIDCVDSIFAKRSPSLSTFLTEQNVDPKLAFGPLHRFLPDSDGSDTSMVLDDPAYHRLTQAPYTKLMENSWAANLHGMLDTILTFFEAYMSRKAFVQTELSDPKLKDKPQSSAERTSMYAEYIEDDTFFNTKDMKRAKLRQRKRAAFSDTILVTARALKNNVDALARNIESLLRTSLSATGDADNAGPSISPMDLENLNRLYFKISCFMGSVNGSYDQMAQTIEKVRALVYVANNKDMTLTRAMISTIQTVYGKHNRTISSPSAIQSNLPAFLDFVKVEHEVLKLSKGMLESSKTTLKKMRAAVMRAAMTCVSDLPPPPPNAHHHLPSASNNHSYIVHPATGVIVHTSNNKITMNDIRNHILSNRYKHNRHILQTFLPNHASLFSICNNSFETLQTFATSIRDGPINQNAANTTTKFFQGTSVNLSLPQKRVPIIPVQEYNTGEESSTTNDDASKKDGKCNLPESWEDVPDIHDYAAILNIRNKHSQGLFNTPDVLRALNRSHPSPSTTVQQQQQQNEKPEGGSSAVMDKRRISINNLLSRLNSQTTLSQLEEYRQVTDMASSLRMLERDLQEYRSSVKSDPQSVVGTAGNLTDRFSQEVGRIFSSVKDYAAKMIQLVERFQKNVQGVLGDSAPSSLGKIDPTTVILNKLSEFRDISSHLEVALSDPEIRTSLLIIFKPFVTKLTDAVSYMNEYYQTLSTVKDELVAAIQKGLHMATDTKREELKSKIQELRAKHEKRVAERKLTTKDTSLVDQTIFIIANKRNELQLQLKSQLDALSTAQNEVVSGISPNSDAVNNFKAQSNVNLNKFNGITKTLRSEDNGSSNSSTGFVQMLNDLFRKYPQVPKEVTSNTMVKYYTETTTILGQIVSILEQVINTKQQRLARNREELEALKAEETESIGRAENDTKSMIANLTGAFVASENIIVSTFSTEVANLKDFLPVRRLVDVVIRKSEAFESLAGSGTSFTESKAVDAVAQIPAAPSEPIAPAFECFTSSLHHLYGVLEEKIAKSSINENTKSDVQLLTISDLATSILNSIRNQERSESRNGSSPSSPPFLVPSKAVPLLCQHCTLTIFGIGTLLLRTRHSLDMRNVAQCNKCHHHQQYQMASSLLLQENNPDVLLSLLSTNNAHMKRLKLTKLQRVAAYFPIASALGSQEALGGTDGSVIPGKIMVPTSETLSCDGDALEKYNSMLIRAHDPKIADGCRTSLVEALSIMAPTTTSLFFPFKDERRFFNSVNNCFLSLSPKANSTVLGVTCDPKYVQVDASTGYPVFRGITTPYNAKCGVFETTATSDARANLPMPFDPKDFEDGTHSLDLSVSGTVAHNANLHRNRHEHLLFDSYKNMDTLIRFGRKDKNSGGDTVEHVLSNNFARTLISGLQTTVGDAFPLSENVKRVIHLGTVSSLAHERRDMVNYSFLESLDKSIQKGMALCKNLAPLGILQIPMAYKLAFDPSQDLGSTLSRNMYFANSLREYNPSSHLKFNLEQDRSTVHYLNDLVSRSNNMGSFISQSDILNLFSVLAQKRQYLSTRSSPNTTTRIMNTMTNSYVDLMSTTLCGAKRTLLLPPQQQQHHYYDINDQQYMLDLQKKVSDVSMDILGSDADGRKNLTALRSVFDSLLTTTNSLFQTDQRLFHEQTKRKVQQQLGTAILSSLRDVEDQCLSYTSPSSSSSPSTASNSAVMERQCASNLLSSALEDIKLAYKLYPKIDKDGQGLSYKRDTMLAIKSVQSNIINNLNTSLREMKRVPLISQYTFLEYMSSLTDETKSIVTKTFPAIQTAKAILSEHNPYLTETLLYNVRDPMHDIALDRLLLLPYYNKQLRDFDNVPSFMPTLMTSSTFRMMGLTGGRGGEFFNGVDHYNSLFLGGALANVRDPVAVHSSLERMESLTSRIGDSDSMSTMKNCACPFKLHHEDNASQRVKIVPPFVHLDKEISARDVFYHPVTTHVLLSLKNYIRQQTILDTDMDGVGFLRRFKACSEMGNLTRYMGAYTPSRAALESQAFRPAGVNLGVIVRPSNLRTAVSMLRCFKRHFCPNDLKLTCATSNLNLLNHTKSKLLESAIPPHRYVQQSTINSSLLQMCNVLSTLIQDLVSKIMSTLSTRLTSLTDPLSISSVSTERVKQNTDLLNSVLFSSSKNTNTTNTDENNPLLSSQLKRSICERLIKHSPVPFSQPGSSSVSFDFLTARPEDGKDGQEEAAGDTSNEKVQQTRMVTSIVDTIFSHISNQVDETTFRSIMDGLQKDLSLYGQSSSSRAEPAPPNNKLMEETRIEMEKMVNTMDIIKTNIVPILRSESMSVWVRSLLSAVDVKARLEALLKYGLSNSFNTDLSHLKPITRSVHIEDTQFYKHVPSMVVFAYENECSALINREQNSFDEAMRARLLRTTFFNSANTKPMSDSGRFVLGAGAGNSAMIGMSTLIATRQVLGNVELSCDPDTTNAMIINPFSEDSDPQLVMDNDGSIVDTTVPKFLQVSTPTMSAGLVANTATEDTMNGRTGTTNLRLRDGTSLRVPRITPYVLSSDACVSLNDALNHTDTTLEDIETTVGYFNEILGGLARAKNVTVSSIIASMVKSSNSQERTYVVDPETGDVTFKGGHLLSVDSRERDIDRLNEGAPKGLADPWSNHIKLNLDNYVDQLISHPTTHFMVNGYPSTNIGLKSYLARQKLFGSDTSEDGILSRSAQAMSQSFANALTEIGTLKQHLCDKLRSLNEECGSFNALGTSSITGRNKNEIQMHLGRLNNATQTVVDVEGFIQRQRSLFLSANDTLNQIKDRYAANSNAPRIAGIASPAVNTPFSALDCLKTNMGIVTSNYYNNSTNNSFLLPSLQGTANLEHSIQYMSQDTLSQNYNSITSKVVKDYEALRSIASSPDGLFKAFGEKQTVASSILAKIYRNTYVNPDTLYSAFKMLEGDKYAFTKVVELLDLFGESTTSGTSSPIKNPTTTSGGSTMLNTLYFSGKTH